MTRISRAAFAIAAAVMVGGSTAPPRADEPVGVFAGHADVGTVLHAGSIEHDPASGRYLVAGSGENMWSTADAFQYAWKPASGDLSIAADVAFEGAGVNPHRKACLVIRQGLEADSA